MDRKYGFNVGRSSATVIVWETGEVHHVPRNAPNFNEVLKVVTGDGTLEDLAKALNPHKAAETFSHGEIQCRDGKLWFRGEVINGGAADKVLQFMQTGADFKPLLRFLERLMANPSRNSREQFYKFLEHKNLPITPEGRVLAYKSVGKDFWSITGGSTKLIEGQVNNEGKIFNGVGEVIRCHRGSVDDNVNNGCSHGLHVGSWEYVQSFGGPEAIRLVVEVDPADIVSVPTECECQKVRTAAYRVVSLADGPLHSRVTEATKSEIQNDLESYEKEREEIEQRQAELESQLRYIANRTHELKSMLDEEEEEEENEDWFTACAYTKSDKLVRSFATDSLDDSRLEDFVLTSLTDGLTVQVKDQDDNDIPLVAIV